MKSTESNKIRSTKCQIDRCVKKKKRSWCLYNCMQAIAFLLCMRLWKRQCQLQQQGRFYHCYEILELDRNLIFRSIESLTRPRNFQKVSKLSKINIYIFFKILSRIKILKFFIISHVTVIDHLVHKILNFYILIFLAYLLK